MGIVATAASTAIKPPPLVPADRSDALSAARALIRVVKGDMILDFDLHNYTRHKLALEADGWTVAEDVSDG